MFEFKPLLFLIFIICVNCFSHTLTEIEKFYLNNHTSFGDLSGVKIDSDEKGLFLRATEDLSIAKMFYIINKDWIFASCTNLFKNSFFLSVKIRIDRDYELNSFRLRKNWRPATTISLQFSKFRLLFYVS